MTRDRNTDRPWIACTPLLFLAVGGWEPRQWSRSPVWRWPGGGAGAWASENSGIRARRQEAGAVPRGPGPAGMGSSTRQWPWEIGLWYRCSPRGGRRAGRYGPFTLAGLRHRPRPGGAVRARPRPGDGLPRRGLLRNINMDSSQTQRVPTAVRWGGGWRVSRRPPRPGPGTASRTRSRPCSAVVRPGVAAGGRQPLQPAGGRAFEAALEEWQISPEARTGRRPAIRDISRIDDGGTGPGSCAKFVVLGASRSIDASRYVVRLTLAEPDQAGAHRLLRVRWGPVWVSSRRL